MKSQIRREMMQKRDAHHSSGGHIHCLNIMERFVQLPEFEKASCMLLYASKGSEVHSDFIIRSALSLGKCVVLPRTIKEEKRLELYRIESIEELSPGAFGILEPPPLPERKVSPDEVDLAVVPGVCFDRRGHRLGYGMGYYDSLLGKLRCKKIGLAYDMQLVEKIPEEPHDIAVDMIVTEREVIHCSSTAGGKRKFRIVVLASGRGSDFQSIIDANKRGEIDVEIAGLITDNPQAKAIERAKENNIPAFAIEWATREELDRKIKEKLDELSPDLVVLAGYMKIIKSKELLSAYQGKIINIHPSLLPKYPGAHAQRDAFEAGEKVSGYTIHFVDESLDGGPIIYQEEVDISDCKTWEEAAAKILSREHVGLPKVVGMASRGEFWLEGKKVVFKPNKASSL
ncbi:MAG: phosphoribosylglycinamide formyltransferase [Candidatus Micrarchaeota archaeon]|nr:phosphoribosylglycinamide formyltransferase [Candidatus Micrarchaeota archaeon]